MNTVHLGAAIALLVFHSLFFFRGVHLRKTGDKPTVPDRLARFFAHVFLPCVVVTGLLARSTTPVAFFTHIFWGIVPICMIPIVQCIRIITRNRHSLPWVLPAVNWVFILCAFVTGLIV